MNLVFKTVTTLAVGLMLTVSQAIAAPTWSISDPSGDAQGIGYLDIKSVTVTEQNGQYEISMQLYGGLNDTSNVNNTYEVDFAKNQDVFNYPGAYADALSLRAGRITTTQSFAYSAVDQSGAQIAIVSNKTDLINNILTWYIDKSAIGENIQYFGGQTLDNLNSYKIIDQTGVAATPIPGAVWLLGSGILGLVGLKRRDTSIAA